MSGGCVRNSDNAVCYVFISLLCVRVGVQS